MAPARTVLEDLPFCVLKAALGFRRLSDTTLRAVGLEPQPAGLAAILHTLKERGDCTVNCLVEETHVPNGTLTGLLDTLEREGHIRRKPNTSDGRSWLIGITPAGRRLCAKLEQRHQVVMQIFNRALSDTEAADLARLLEKLTTGMRAYVAEQERAPKPSTAAASRANLHDLRRPTLGRAVRKPHAARRRIA